MKKVLALILALVFALSLAACGDNGNSEEKKTSNVSMDSLKSAMKEIDLDADYSKSGDTYTAKTSVNGKDVDVEIKADENDKVLSVSIVNHDIYNKSLESKDSITDFFKRFTDDPGQLTIGELYAAQSLREVISLKELISTQNDDTSYITDAYSGGCDVNGWRLQAVPDAEKDTVTVTATFKG